MSSLLRAETDRRAALAIGLVVLALAATEVVGQYVASTWIQRDGRFYVNVSTTLAENGSLEQPFAASWYTGTLGWNRELDVGWSNIALGGHGEHYPKHTWLLPLLSLPLFYALGLLGTLVFNVLVYGAAGVFSYRFARAYAGPAASAIAVIALLYATGVRENIYDYHVDPVILALGTAAMACAVESRGAAAGTLLGMVVLMRPTALMLLPPLVLVLAERRAWRALGRAMLAGAAVLTAGAMVNWWMFGRPWLSGYNRILAVVHGVPQIVDNAGSFRVPLDEGWRRTWGGAYGLRSRAPVMALAAPGLLWLLLRRPMYALGAVALTATSLLVFSKYVFEGDRFHFLAFAFLLPALAATFDLVVWLGARSRTLRASSLTTPLAVFVLGTGALLLLYAGAYRAPVLQDGELLARLVLSALLAGATCAALARVAEPALAAAVALVPLLLPGVRDALLATSGGVGSSGLGAATCAALAIAVLAQAPRGRARSEWLVGGVAALLAGVAAWWTLGEVTQVLASPAAQRSLELGALRETFRSPGPARALVPLLLLAVPGALVALRRDARTGAALVVLLFALAPAARPAPTSALVTLALVLPLAPLTSAIAARVARLRGRRTLALAGAALVLLAMVGFVVRSAEASARLRLATPRAVRLAEVYAGEVPCDFLAWEHLSWECSHIDAGLYQLTGLATSDPPRVGGARVPLFVISTASFARARTVTWHRVRGGRVLVLDWAVPDGQRGGVDVEIAVDSRTVDRFEVPLAPTARLETRTIATSFAYGRDVALRVTVRSRGGIGLVALDGGFAD